MAPWSQVNLPYPEVNSGSLGHLPYIVCLIPTWPRPQNGYGKIYVRSNFNLTYIIWFITPTLDITVMARSSGCIHRVHPGRRQNGYGKVRSWRHPDIHPGRRQNGYGNNFLKFNSDVTKEWNPGMFFHFRAWQSGLSVVIDFFSVQMPVVARFFFTTRFPRSG